MADIIQLRGGTSTQATSVNPILAEREMGIETDTLMFKIGDGITAWNSLGYGGLIGADGNLYEFRFQIAETQPTTPTEREPVGWTVTPPEREADEKVWVTLAEISGSDNSLDSTWSTPSLWADTGFLPTFETVSGDATATIGSIRHTIYATATAVLTLPDETRDDTRVQIFNISSDDVVMIQGTGVTNYRLAPGLSVEYSWKESKWNLFSQAGGDVLGSLQVPQPKTWVEKWNDGGVDTTTKLNEWGPGLYHIVIESTGTGAGVWTCIMQIDDDTEEHNSNPYTNEGTANANLELFYNGSTTKNFEITAVSGAIVKTIRSITRWEDDPDNLPLQTIPADPSLIKDWVNKYDEPSGTDTTVMNAWGTGLYRISYWNSTLSYEASTFIRVRDISVVTWSDSSSGNASSNTHNKVRYDGAGVFDFQGADIKYFRSIDRWEDVAGADAQMSVPVDGWEKLSITAGASVVNSWGEGTYSAVLSSGVQRFTSNLVLSDITSQCLGTVCIDSQTPTTKMGIDYTPGTNSFNSRYTGYDIVELRKFNSLVNVLHSYHPDPRQVAQKDWVEVYNSPINSASNTTFKVTDGKYIVSSGPANDTITYETSISIDNTKTLCRCVHDASFNLEYTPSTGVWNTNISNVGIHFISKWQDSQASDSPRTALDDGFETVYENSASTSNSVAISSLSSWGPGVYCVEATLGSGGVVRSALISIPDITVDSAVDFYGTADLTYDASAQTISSDETAHYLIRIRKLTGKTVIAAQYNTVSLSDGENQIIKEVPTVADINVTLPASPSLGDLFEVYNGASIGTTYKVNITTDGSTLYRGLRIGAGKNLRMRYIDGWEYEDVVIDEYSGTASGTNVGSGTYRVTKWAGGRMEQEFYLDPSSAAATTPNLPESFDGTYYSNATVAQLSSNRTIAIDYATAPEKVAGYSTTGSIQAVDILLFLKGRWKTGV